MNAAASDGNFRRQWLFVRACRRSTLRKQAGRWLLPPIIAFRIHSTARVAASRAWREKQRTLLFFCCPEILQVQTCLKYGRCLGSIVRFQLSPILWPGRRIPCLDIASESKWKRKTQGDIAKSLAHSTVPYIMTECSIAVLGSVIAFYCSDL